MKQFFSKIFEKKKTEPVEANSEKFAYQPNEIHDRYPDRNVVSDTHAKSVEDRWMKPAQKTGDAIASGICGNNVKWTLYENGQLVISGNGIMSDYLPNTYEDGKKVAPWYFHCSEILSIKIEKGVSHIGKWSFAYCRNLIKVEFEGHLDELPWGSFAFAEKLVDIIIPNGVNRIASEVFLDCHALHSVSLPKGLEEIGEEAFYNCYSLSEINLPNTLTDIDGYAFAFCGQLTRLHIPRNVTYIHEKAFFKSGIRH